MVRGYALRIVASVADEQASGDWLAMQLPADAMGKR